MPETVSCIYLASSSPRRRELLHQIGVNFKALIFRSIRRGRDADIDETPLPGESPDHYVERMALNKAHAGMQRLFWRKLPYHPVLAADTAIDIDGCIIGKPDNADDACEILRQLSGRSHRVLTAVALNDDEHIQSRLSVSDVKFRPLTEDDIRRYVATGEPMDKAGAYAIQGRAAAFIMEICGSYSGIMGLPLFETASLLEAFGYRFEPSGEA
ncbi:MAG: Maf family nucleotide pyrophosphatase [Betaproteobacteria bacterium]|nr:Maf family nucleotide pyrophosphatase [Betaproteobacteria bacterium]